MCKLDGSSSIRDKMPKRFSDARQPGDLQSIEIVQSRKGKRRGKPGWIDQVGQDLTKDLLLFFLLQYATTEEHSGLQDRFVLVCHASPQCHAGERESIRRRHFTSVLCKQIDNLSPL